MAKNTHVIRFGVIGTIIGVSLFCGIMIGWVGPILFPPISQVAQPFICPGGELVQEIIQGHSPGEVTYNTAFQCYSGNGEQGRDVTTSAILTAIGVYAAITAVILTLLALRGVRRYRQRMADTITRMDAPGVEVDGRSINMRGADRETKLRVLAELYKQGLLPDAKYEALVAKARREE